MRHFAALLMLCLIGMAPVAWAQDTYSPPLSGEMMSLEVFQKPVPVPEIILSSRPTGTKYLSEIKGKITLLNVWATWCPPCVEEMPSFNELQAGYDKKELSVIAVSLENNMDIVKKFMDDNKIDKLTPFIDVNGDIQKLEALRVAKGVPATLILNRDMEAIAFYQGDANWSSPEARAVIDYFVTYAGNSKSRRLPASMRNYY
jgi:thiol-disulfide isomerase/thioredoxin